MMKKMTFDVSEFPILHLIVVIKEEMDTHGGGYQIKS